MVNQDQGGQTELSGLVGQTDEQLLENYSKTKNPQAFRILHDRHTEGLTKYLHKITQSDSVTEDAVQQTFLHVHQKHDQFQPGQKFRPWLYSIAANFAIDTYRATHGRQGAPGRPLTFSFHELRGVSTAGGHDQRPFDPEDEKASTPFQASEHIEDHQLLYAALQKLSDTDRQIIQLVFFEKLSSDEAAARLGMNANTVRSRQARAIASMRREMVGDDDLSAVA